MPKIITLLSDFGSRDAFVGIMKGVILGISPQSQCIDLSHEVEAQQILPGALLLRSAVPYFPPTTIHLAVVDPGVGSERRPLVVVCERGMLVGPDNGLLSLAAATLGLQRIFAIEPGRLTRAEISHTFHGRDVFAPVAAHLANGVAADRCGTEIASMVELAPPQPRHDATTIDGEVIYVDHFGNLITNIAAELLTGFSAPTLSVTIAATHVHGLASSYASVPVGAPLAIIGSWGVLEVAIRNDNAAQILSVRPGMPVRVVSGVSNS